MLIYSVYDSKAGAYITPIYAVTDGVAIRMFQEAATDENHDFYKYAGDFTLFKLGEWNEIAGTITPYPSKQNMGTALELKSTSYIQGE